MSEAAFWVGLFAEGMFMGWTCWAIFALQANQRKTERGLWRTARLVVHLHGLDSDTVKNILVDPSPETP